MVRKRPAANSQQSLASKRMRSSRVDHREPTPTDDSNRDASSLDLSVKLPTLTANDYTIGWICALQDELAAAQAMLDTEHQNLSQDERDSNTYTLGEIGPHNVVLACLSVGTMGANATATAAANMLRSFPKIRFGLMVGIGGGAPKEPSDDPIEDIRLGDVVVSNPEGIYSKNSA
jgi:hypothetical protein